MSAYALNPTLPIELDAFSDAVWVGADGDGMGKTGIAAMRR